MADIEIKGAEKFEKVAKALKQAGDKELSKELYSALNRATKPMRADAKESARENLPRRGGLNRQVAKARLSTRRSAGKNPGIRIVAKGPGQLALTNSGYVRHPVWGNRGRWVVQSIPDAKGWFTKAMEDGKPQAQREIIKSLEAVAKKLARKY